MLSPEARHRIRTIVISRLAGDEQDEERLADSDELVMMLETHLELEPETARVIAYARSSHDTDEEAHMDDLCELSDRLHLDEDLLFALMSEASREVIEHSMLKALDQDMSCRECLDLRAEHSPGMLDQDIEDLALRVLDHVEQEPALHVDADNSLTVELLRVWNTLDSPYRLAVLGAAIREQAHQKMREEGSVSPEMIVHEWYYSHLPTSLRIALGVLGSRKSWSAAPSRIIAAVPDLASVSGGDDAKRLALLFRAAHARMCASLSQNVSDIVQLKRRGGRMVIEVAPVWREQVRYLLDLEVIGHEQT